ncbi:MULTISPECIES: hypothetical protein [unclassified Pseudomonas]|uniref:hypothetical protein n=1 Tax=unclassified Pseudomonas TaxID=196821 RepID=UPI00114D3105|nr:MULTISPECIES: hypothetical protein [unclassified Pseudomonas]QIH07603.1 hypothetical protein ATY02_13220 [Pseudomonas sp. BIOMIG1BAC]
MRALKSICLASMTAIGLMPHVGFVNAEGDVAKDVRDDVRDADKDVKRDDHEVDKEAKHLEKERHKEERHVEKEAKKHL